MKDLKVEFWLPETQDSKLKYSAYWNDDEIEKTKAWYVLNGNFAEMANHLKNTGLPADLERSVSILKTDFGINLGGTGIDLAAGNLWAVPYLFEMGVIQKLYCLEYSKHRLLKIGPTVLGHFNVPIDRVVLVYGSFYHLHIEDNSIDFVLLSSAFHHADEPHKLLSEIQRVLKKNGVIIIIGEHIIRYHKAYIRNAIKFFISKFMPANLQEAIFSRTFQAFSLFPEPNQLFPPDPVSGDHYYTLQEYRTMFSKYHFRHFINKKSQFQSFVLVKP